MYRVLQFSLNNGNIGDARETLQVTIIHASNNWTMHTSYETNGFSDDVVFTGKTSELPHPQNGKVWAKMLGESLSQIMEDPRFDQEESWLNNYSAEDFTTDKFDQ